MWSIPGSCIQSFKQHEVAGLVADALAVVGVPIEVAELVTPAGVVAVLVAISIPIFTTQLEKSREATDEANIRACYAEVMTAALTNEKGSTESASRGTIKTAATVYSIKYTDGDANTGIWTGTVTLKQAQDGWQNTSIKEIAGIDVSAMSPKKGKTCTITYIEKTDTVAIAFPAS
ncbi:hypothetical protein [Oribacterium sp. Sow4_G1_1]|uniref:hypothetical protein n=1 Tax=Oribacterium sp. Sow4_G1_1 TaxID=3438794 RepID=UPI003F987F74